MKKLFMLLVIAVAAISCSEEENAIANNILGTGLTGTWKLTGMYNGEMPMALTECNGNSKLIFGANYSASQTTGADTPAGCQITTSSGIYAVAGNSLTLSLGLVQAGYEILEQSSTTLKLSPITGDGDTATLVFTKQ